MGVMRNLSFRWGTLVLIVLFAFEAAAQSQTHSVQRKETAYGIAKAYGVDLNALYELNPWAESGLRKGDVLRIPASIPPAPKAEPVVDTTPPAATPAPAVQDTAPARPGVLSRIQGGEGVTDETGHPRSRPMPPSWGRDTLRVAVFLPFYSGRDSLGRQEARLRDVAADCAAGIRLALDSGRPAGAHFEVQFLDVGRDTSGALLCTPDDLVGLGGPVDIAVGPLKRSQFLEVRTWPQLASCVHVALTDLGASLVEGQPGVLMPFVPVEQRMKALASFVANHHRGERVLLLATGDIRSIVAEGAFREAWTALQAGDSLLLLDEVEVASRGLGALRDSLTDVRRNVLVVPGGKANRSFAGVLQTEMQLGDSMEFVLYADAAWREFDFLDASLMNRVQFTIVDGGGNLPDSSRVAPVDSSYFCLARRMVELKGTPVESYGWMAHDVMREAMGWTAGYGPGWPLALGQGPLLIRPVRAATNGQYRFEWAPVMATGGGLINTAVRILRQQDYQWVEWLNTVPAHQKPTRDHHHDGR
jgi:LysM repeat protein